MCRHWPTALLGVSERGAMRACACWACLGYKPAVLVSMVVAPPVSLSPGARHLRACPRDRLLPLPGTPGPRASVLEGVSPGGGVASFPVGSECELQESVAVVAGCACFERGCCFTRAAVGFIFGLRIRSASLLELSRCLVCHVAALVECCDTCLWLLPALCYLVVNSGEVLPEFFSVGSGGGEVSEVVEALFRCGPASPSHCLTLRWFRSHVWRLGVGPQLGRAAVVCSCSLL
ncbi:hypothetical protein Taro_047663 [Colocasia esculenta]|uniref:Uncharacterized protein n=1 Tax=Colocasia esculenta TaxID=4460 RepID=A0A843X461_COLES|nr:hypothetical protein [Colocasia esculenta]